MKKKVKISTTYGTLIEDLVPAINRLGSLVFKDVSIMIKVASARRKLRTEFDKFKEIQKVISEKNCLKDNNEKPITEKGFYTYKNELIKKETFNLIKELSEQKIIFELDPIDAIDLEGIEGVTPNDVESLGNFIKL